MSRRVVIALSTRADADRHWRDYLQHGGALGPPADRSPGDEVVIVLSRPGAAALELPARVVQRAGDGVGYELDGFGAPLRERIDAWLHAPAHEPSARNLHERLRGLTIPQQLELARKGELNERIAIERMLGKTVWELLLRNPKITPPEVARIARMGTLPAPLVELIVANAGWLAVPEVRRALLSNPRLSLDLIPRVLKLLPRHELKQVPAQTAYPWAVRDAARKLLPHG